MVYTLHVIARKLQLTWNFSLDQGEINLHKLVKEWELHSVGEVQTEIVP